MEYWSPQAAMKAYLQTLNLCNNAGHQVMEPKSMEFISAMAAGKRAKLMVEITSQGVTNFTLALAVAAKQTGNRFVCILPHNSHHNSNNILDMEDMIEVIYADNPLQVMDQYKMIDFAVVDCKIEHYVKILKQIDINPNGSTVVVHNNLHHKSLRRGALFEHVVKKKNNRLLQYITLPFGEGMELTRVTRSSRRRRFHVTYEN